MKVLIIGADSALSAAIINDLDQSGIHYVATSRRKESVHYMLDVSDFESISIQLKKIVNEHPDITHLIYTPAITADGISHRVKVNKWQEVFGVNLFGAIAVINALLPHFMKNKHGHIQLVSSSSSINPELYAAAYSASKSALASYARSIAQEYARFGITCYAFSPGFFSGGMEDQSSSKRIAHIESRIPRGKMADKEEVAQFSIQLLKSTHYINGANIIFNGGM